MKFALTRIILISVDDCDTQADALGYIEKMYKIAYGARAGAVDPNRMTPNEERLSEALVERFGRRYKTYVPGGTIYATTGSRAPITVYCNDQDFLFGREEPHEGLYWPFNDIAH